MAVTLTKIEASLGAEIGHAEGLDGFRYRIPNSEGITVTVTVVITGALDEAAFRDALTRWIAEGGWRGSQPPPRARARRPAGAEEPLALPDDAVDAEWSEHRPSELNGAVLHRQALPRPRGR